MLVAVPARDEAATAVACLESIDRAAAAWGRPVVTVVACDSCVDDTVVRVEAWAPRAMHVHVIEGSWRGAGAARRAATARGALLLGTDRPACTWLASTDADTTVPPDWITRQVALADGGADVVLGIVELDSTTPPNLRNRFAATYVIHPGHRHVHAANMGVRRSTYDVAGGWSADISVGEEHDLVARAVAAGARVARRHDVVVTTSARTSSRVSDGFAHDLAALLAPADL